MAVDIARFLSGIPSPVDRLQEGVAFGAGLADRRASRQAAEAAAAQQEALSGELAALANNPNKTPDDYLSLMTRFPDLADKFKVPLEQLNTEQRQTTLGEATSVYAALAGGRTGIALDILQDRKEAAENSGDEQAAQSADIMMETIKFNPEAAMTTTGLFLANALGPEQFQKMVGTLGEQLPKPQAPLTGIAKLNADLAAGLITPEQHAAAQAKLESLPAGQSIVVSPDGTMTVTTGGAGGEIQKGTRSKIESDLLANRARLDRVNAIAENFKPELLEVGTRLGTTIDVLQEKFKIGDITPEERQGITDMFAFQQSAFNDLNQTLKEMSGAAINPQEAERLLKAMPNPGTGIFDGDSPTQFIAKWNGVVRDLNRSQARLQYAYKNGLDFDAIPLGAIDGIISARRKELIDDGLTSEAANAILKTEFGL